MTTILLSKEFSEYNKALAKINVYGSTLDTLNNEKYTITLTEKRWELGTRKNFSRKPQMEEKRVITARQYACYITSIGFFRDRVQNGYTPAGYIPTRLTCKSPDGEQKIERYFRIEYVA